MPVVKTLKMREETGGVSKVKKANKGIEVNKDKNVGKSRQLTPLRTPRVAAVIKNAFT
jgi:hypothetical protein